MDKRDELTRALFDESTVEIVDNTDGAFTTWFEGDLERIARLSGAPANSTVRIDYLDEGGYKLTATGPNLEGEMVRLVLQDEDAQPVLYLYNNAFVLPPQLRGQKIGVRSVAIELLEAQKTGEFAYVAVDAIGDITTLNPDNPVNQYSGYAVWPQLGFDGEIPQEIRHKPELQPFQRVSEVLGAPDGKALWLQHGSSCRLRFDLHEGSPCWVVLYRYMQDNEIEVQR